MTKNTDPQPRQTKGLPLVLLIGAVAAGSLFFVRGKGLSGHATGVDENAAETEGCGGSSYYEVPLGEGGTSAISQSDSDVEDMEEFAMDFAEAACELYDDCNRLDGIAGGIDRCLEIVEDGFLDTEESQCDFNSKAADDCLIEIDEMECEEIEDTDMRDSACYQVCGNIPTWMIF